MNNPAGTENPALGEKAPEDVVSPKAPAAGVGTVVALVVARLLGELLDIDVDEELEAGILALVGAIGAIVGAYLKRDPLRRARAAGVNVRA